MPYVVATHLRYVTQTCDITRQLSNELIAQLDQVLFEISFEFSIRIFQIQLTME